MRAYFPVPQNGVQTEVFSPQNDRTTELSVNFLLTATVCQWLKQQKYLSSSTSFWKFVWLNHATVAIKAAVSASKKYVSPHKCNRLLSLLDRLTQSTVS